MKIFNKKYIIAIALIFWAGILYSQDGYTTSNDLKDNVVRIKTSYADDSDDNGFGIIISETGNKLYIITADHVVQSDDVPEEGVISVNFYSQQAYDIKAKYLKGKTDVDLAILVVEKPKNFKWKKNCLANIPNHNDDVWFIGKESEWEIPTSSENGSISNISSYNYEITSIFKSKSIASGTSGAPLLNKYGIIGLMIKNASRETKAIDIQTIKKIITSDWNYPWQLETYSESNKNYIEKLANGFSFEMIAVEGGRFKMGTGQGNKYERPAHNVILSSFMIGKYEVTQKLWKTVMGNNNNPSGFKGDNLPVEQVNWKVIESFIKKLNKMTGKKYRLPTEAEWEYAARGGITGGDHTYSGSSNIDEVAWYGLKRAGSRTHDVGMKSPNELGIYDMSGNVAERCSDFWHTYSSGTQRNPTGPYKGTGTTRVVRGGGWSAAVPSACTVTHREYVPSTRQNNRMGFRLVLVQ